MSELVGDGGNDTSSFPRFCELSRAEKIATQYGVLVGIAILLEPFGYCIRDGSFTRASVAGQPEDTRAPGRGIVSPFGDDFQYLDARSGRALVTLQGLLFENSFVVSLLGGTQTF